MYHEFNTRVKVNLLSLALFTTGYVVADATDDLIVAIDAGNVAGVKLALKQGADVDAQRTVTFGDNKITATAREWVRSSLFELNRLNERKNWPLEMSASFAVVGFTTALIGGLFKNGSMALAGALVGSVGGLISAIQIKQYLPWIRIYKLVSPKDKLKDADEAIVIETGRYAYVPTGMQYMARDIIRRVNPEIANSLLEKDLK